MTLDRTKAPAFKSIDKIEFPHIIPQILDNGVKVYKHMAKDQEVLKVEVVWKAGSVNSNYLGLGTLYPKMLLGGTSTKNANDVVELFAQWGGFTEFSQDVQKLSLSVYGLSRHFDKYIAALSEVILNSNFNSEELSLQKNIAKSGLELNLQKPSYLANRELRKALFGDENLFGKWLAKEDIEEINSEILLQFHKENVLDVEFDIFLSGDLPENYLTILNNIFGKKALKGGTQHTFDFQKRERQEIILEKKESVQSTLRIGQMMFNRNHPDFYKFIVTNTIFGGYFGSRLMKNIREEKGFTYGISSSLVNTASSGYFFLGADIVKENTVATLTEIEKEMNTLKTEKVTEKELQTVKSYMIGTFASSINNSFDIMDRYKKCILEEMPMDYYQHQIGNINAISVDDIYEMANQYLNLSEMITVVVGEKI